MSELRKVTCDGCGRDLTATANCVDYRLVLEPQSIPSAGGAVTAMHIEPDIRSARHFCGLRCLEVWMEKSP